MRTTTADGTTIHRAYDLRGNLDRVTEGVDGANVLLESIAYNARGQRVGVRRGNGTRTAHAYDPWTFRLTSTWSGKLDGSGALQDLAYTYDAVGNVVRQVDAAQPVVFHANAKVEPAQTFRYDAAYRLVEATGREQVVPGYTGAPGPDGMPATKLPATALRNYTQTYGYDAVGNLTSMVHQAGAGNASSGWTRTYVYAPNSSRLASTQVGNTTSTYSHDAAGNITAMPHLPGGLGWDVDDRLRWSDRGAGSVTAYGYDAGGERVFKANARRRTVYLPGGADLQLSFAASGIVTSRTWTLSVGDDAGVLVRFERTELPGKLPVTLARFALSDLLRSVTVEVDDVGNLLGFEQYTPYGDSCVRVVVSQAAGYSTSRYRFNGKERDVEETGLYYYGARYYACWLGRWVGCDPSVDVRGSAYGFCAGNPTSLVDLDGRADKRPSEEPMSAGDALAGEFGSDSGERGVVLGIALVNWLFSDVLPTFSELATLGPGAHSRKHAGVATPERSKGGKGTSGSQDAAQGRTSDVGTVGNDHSRVTPRVEQRSEASRWFDLTSHAPDAASVETSKRLSAGDVDVGAHSATPSAGVGVVDAREATASQGVGRAFGGLSRAAEFGVKPYNQLTKSLKGSGLHAHHLIEQRFAGVMGQNARHMSAVAVTPAEHQVFTKAWRQLIPYGEAGTGTATRESVLNAARQVYQGHPEILKALGL